MLSACIRVSAGMLAVSLPAREVARRASSQLFGTDQDVIDRLLESAFLPQGTA